MAKVSNTERDEAIEVLRGILSKGDTVYTVIRHVSASGTTRRIDTYVISDNKPRYLSGYVAKALGYTMHKSGGIVVAGYGMDMGFDLIYNLSSRLYGHDDRGGYALQQKWL